MCFGSSVRNNYHSTDTKMLKNIKFANSVADFDLWGSLVFGNEFISGNFEVDLIRSLRISIGPMRCVRLINFSLYVTDCCRSPSKICAQSLWY